MHDVVFDLLGFIDVLKRTELAILILKVLLPPLAKCIYGAGGLGFRNEVFNAAKRTEVYMRIMT